MYVRAVQPSALYIPVYYHYRAGCVTGTDGTLFTNNAYSFVYNYAAADYNIALSKGYGE